MPNRQPVYCIHSIPFLLVTAAILRLLNCLHVVERHTDVDVVPLLLAWDVVLTTRGSLLIR